MRAWIALSLTVGCGGLRLHLHESSVEKPSNVAVYFSVETSDGKPVPELQADAFQIYEDGQLISPYESKQTILNPEVAVVHYTLLLLDLSGSVTESGSLPLLIEGASAFADEVTRFHQIGVSGFDGRPDLTTIADFTSSGGTVRSSLARLSSFKPRDPSTNLNGAMVAAVNRLEAQLDRARQPLRFATLVVFTDGTDRAHRVTERLMLEHLDKSRVNVFVIALGGEIDLDTLSRIATTSLVRAEDTGGIGAAFKRVAADIEASGRKFYLLSYCSPSRARSHRLRVTVAAGDRTGSLEHQFDAAGFGPGCDPTSKPSFPIGRIRLPSSPG